MHAKGLSDIQSKIVLEEDLSWVYIDDASRRGSFAAYEPTQVDIQKMRHDRWILANGPHGPIHTFWGA